MTNPPVRGLIDTVVNAKDVAEKAHGVRV